MDSKSNDDLYVKSERLRNLSYISTFTKIELTTLMDIRGMEGNIPDRVSRRTINYDRREENINNNKKLEIL